MLAEMRSKRIVACLLVLGIAGAIGLAPRKAEAQTSSEYSVLSVNQYAYVAGDPDLCTSYTIPLDTLITEDGVYVSYLIRNEVYYPGWGCMAMASVEPKLRKYNQETAELIWEFAAEPPTPLGNITALTMDSGGNVWGLVLNMGVFPTQYILLKIDPSTGYEITRIVIGVSGYDVRLHDLTADQADQTNSLHLCGEAAPKEGTTGWEALALKISPTGDTTWTAFPDVGAKKLEKIAVGKKKVFCTATDEYWNTCLTRIDGDTGNVDDVSDPIPDLKINDVVLCPDLDWVVLAGETPDHNGKVDGRVVVMDPATGRVGELKLVGEGDDPVNGCRLMFSDKDKEISEYLLLGSTEGFLEPAQSEDGFAMRVRFYGDEVDIKACVLGVNLIGVLGGDVSLVNGDPLTTYSLAGVGTTTCSFHGAEYHGADEESFVAILYDPVAAVEALIAKVEAMNLHQGIDNSLDVKLDNARKSLESVNAGNRQDAVNKLQAFINECVAQSGNKLTPEQADELIGDTLVIIDALQG